MAEVVQAILEPSLGWRIQRSDGYGYQWVTHGWSMTLEDAMREASLNIGKAIALNLAIPLHP